MEDFRAKAKKLMEKLANPSKPKFAGQGHRLGSVNSEQKLSSRKESLEPSPSSQKVSQGSSTGKSNKLGPEVRRSSSATSEQLLQEKSNAAVASAPIISEALSVSLNLQEEKSFNCPVCGVVFNSEVDIDHHVDQCLVEAQEKLPPPINNSVPEEDDQFSEIKTAAAVLLSVSPPAASLEVLSKILANIVNDPSLEKYRRIRMANPKIMQSIGSVVGATELLLAAGFRLETQPEDSETWAVMAFPSDNQILGLKVALQLLQSQISSSASAVSSSTSFLLPVVAVREQAPLEKKSSLRSTPRKLDRVVKVFLPVEENMAKRIEVPDSNYELTSSEVKALVASGRKTLEQSKELTTRAWKERQAAANRRRCKVAIIRIQFPDLFILEGQFFPSEPTSALYEFAADSLHDPAQEFDLIFVLPPRNSILPAVGSPDSPPPSLQDAQLVPAALIKFRPLIKPRGNTWLKKELVSLAQQLLPKKS